MIGNGVLAGLVAITAGCGAVTPIVAVRHRCHRRRARRVRRALLRPDQDRRPGRCGHACTASAAPGACSPIGLFAKYDDAFLGREDAGLFYGGGFDQLVMQVV